MHFFISLHLKNGKPFASAYWRIGLKYASALNILLVYKFLKIACWHYPTHK